MTFTFKKFIFIYSLLGFIVSPLLAQELHLNEVLSSNESTIVDEDGDFEDWIEIYNSGDQPISLSGFGLSDDSDELFRWSFPDTTIQAGQFILVWASGKDRATQGLELHTNYAVSADGEELYLTHSDGTLLDQSPERELTADISLGRHPDGTGQWFRFYEPTPGAPNTTEETERLLEKPNLSHNSGFYGSSFNLMLSHSREDVSFYYTLDGSEPTVESKKYNEPISIIDRSNEPNSLSTIPTNFMNGRYGFQVPNVRIPKGTVLRVKAVKDGFHPVQSTYSFFVFPEGKEKHQLPVISITTDSMSLFGDEKGIYVPGKNYEGSHDSGNYYESGEDWEREASFEFFDDNGELQISQKIGVRIHGGFTRRFPQKSLRIYARNKYGQGSINYKIFPNLEYDKYERLIIRNSGNDWGMTMFREAAAHEIVKHFSMDTQSSRPSVVYINGEYWGIHNIRERFDDNYLERVYDVDGDNIDYVQNFSQVQYGSAEDYFSMLNFIDSWDLSVQANMDSVKTMMDIDNYIDYYTAEIYFQNMDWPHGNIEFWRLDVPYDKDAPPKHDGRWRWLFFDVDASFGFVKTPDFDMLGYVTQKEDFRGREWPNLILRNLLENESFKHEFINRMADHLNTSFQTSRVIGIIEDFRNTIRHEMPQFIERWNYPDIMSEWWDYIISLNGFARRRPELLRENILNHFDIESTEEVTVDLENIEQGKILVNSLLISAETPGISTEAYPWTGTYFSGIPINLSSEPNMGYHLSHWVIDGENIYEKELKVLPDTTESILAVFKDFSLDDIEPHKLAETDYNFSEWNSNQQVGTYPKSMVFTYMDSTEPELDASIAGITQGLYNLNSRTRIEGLGEDGFAFINTSNEDGNPGYPGNRLGGAVLSLNTRGQKSVKVTFKAGTVEPNSRIYNIRLQYRLNTEDVFQDVLDENGDPVEYLRNEEAGHSQIVGPIELPVDVENQKDVELLWRYYYTGERVDEENGQRSKLNISEIKVTSEPLSEDESGPREKVRLFQNYPNPFYPSTTIRYELPSDQNVKIDLFSIDGRHITTLEDKEAESGSHHLDIDLNGLASGIYLYRLKTNDFIVYKKMSVVK